MPSRSASAKKEKIVAIFDIGTSVVSGALVSIPVGKAERPVILHTARSPIPVQDEFDFKRFFQLVLASLERTARALATHHGTTPEHSYCFLSSPWYASQTRTINFARPKPFPFTKKFATELIDKDLKAFESTYLKNYAEIGSPVTLMENKIIEIKLNGYKAPDPFGKRASSLAMHLYFSMSSRALLESLEHVLHRSLHIAPVSFHSFAFASFVIGKEATDTEDFLLVDIAGEMTDVSIIKEGVFAESVSFPSGKNAILRRIATQFASSEKESLSLLTTYATGKLTHKAASNMDAALTKPKKDWIRRFQEALFQLSNHASIPHKVVLSVDGDVATLFKGAIEGEEFAQYMRTPGKFDAILMEYDLLRKYCKVADGGDRDPFLMIESLFVSKLL